MADFSTPESPTDPFRLVLEEWCSAPRLSALTTLFVAFLRDHWRDVYNQVHDNLADKLWEPPQATGQGTLTPGRRGGITIDKASHFKPDTAGLRPALLVRRGKFVPNKASIGDLYHFENELTGERNYVRMWEGSVAVQAIAQTEEMCEDLIMEATREILHFGPGLAEAAGLDRISVTDVSETQLSDEYKNHWTALTEVKVHFQENWRIIPQGPLLRTAALQQTTE